MANKPADITIGITNGPDTERFALFAMQTCIATADFPKRLKFTIAVPAEADMSRFQATFKQLDPEIFSVSNDGLSANFMRNSFAHCRSLQRLFERMKTPLGMFCDCDVAFLKQGWDLEMESCLDTSIPIIGTAYPEHPVEFLREIRGQRARVYKYQNFPNVVTCLFLVERLRELGVDFENLERQAGKTDQEVLISEQEPLLQMAEIPAGGKWMLDTGFDLPLKIKGAGGSGIPIKNLSAGDGKVLQQSGRMTLDDGYAFPAGSEEYQLNGEAIVTHFGKASRRDFGSPEAEHWRDQVKRYISAQSMNPTKPIDLEHP